MASTIDKIKNDIIEAVNASQKQTSAYDTEAEVVRIDGNTAWVHIAGGVTETPVQLTINAQKGDKVQVRVSNEGAWIMGNATAPPTDDTKAEEAKQEIVNTNIIVKAVKAIAEQAQKIAGNTNQYFWHTQSGTDTGAHITEIPQEDFIANPQNGGGNLLARSNGIAVRDGLAELATFSSSGARIGQINETHVEIDEDSFLMFDSNGTKFAHIGSPSSEEITDTFVYSSGNQFILSSTPSSSVTVALNDTVLTLNVDYTLSQTGIIITLIIPATVGDVITATYTTSEQLKYYTFGTRLGNSGEYSIAEGFDTTSSGFGSHAEGWKTIASGQRSHAEGERTQALGFNSHAEGVRSIANGSESHAEGYETEAKGYTAHAEGSQTEANNSSAHAEGLATKANGAVSHAGGHGTIAGYYAQTVIGKFNDNNSSTAFEIGNGSSYDARSNAFTVDWDGKISTPQIQGGTSDCPSIPANSYVDVTVTFTQAFSSVPLVICCLGSTSTAGAIGSLSVAVYSTTVSSVTFRVFNAGASSRQPSIRWFGINI